MIWLNDIQWSVAWREKSALDEQFMVIPNPWWGWAADPFLIESEGKTYIFAEIWNFFEQKGCIGYIVIEDGKFGKWKVAIEEWYHLSYPFIWKDEKGFHMCAETSRIKETYCYDCIGFPDKWKRGITYNKGLKLADTTFLFNSNKEIVLALSYEVGINHGRLISLSLDWDGSYEIISDDLHNARMAGAFIEKNNEIYRLAQIGDKSYGQGIVINQISNIEPYEEKNIKEIYCENIKCGTTKETIGIHTYNCSSKYEVIDIRYHEFNLINFLFGYIMKMVNFFGRNIIKIVKKCRNYSDEN